MNKKEIYSKRDAVERYESRRFGGKSGSYVNSRERGVFEQFLKDEKGKFCLDLACGTGRFIEAWSKRYENVIGVDYSENMLKRARKREVAEFVRGDVFHLPFRDETFDIITIGRLFQHYKNIEGLLIEARRVLKREGVVVFDFLKWSPRNICPSGSSGKVFRHNKNEIEDISRRLKLKIEKQESSFLFAPGIYRFLPFGLVRMLDRLEEIIPERFLVRSFFKLRKAS